MSPILLVLLFVGSCLADTATMTLNTAGKVTAGNDTRNNPIAFGNRLPATVDPVSLSADIWNNQSSRTGVIQMQDFNAGPIFSMEVLNNSGSTANHNLYVWALLDGSKDNSTWTAANQTIMNKALDSTVVYDPQLSSRFPHAKEYGSPERWIPGPECERGPSPAPEPSTFLMIGSGLIMLVFLLRGRQRGRRTS
jgi:hypothetical protein